MESPHDCRGFIDLLAALGVQRSLSRPRVSNDNSVSEARLKTIEYQPDYHGPLSGAGHARRWFGEFFHLYVYQHRHSGLAPLTRAEVFFGRVPELACQRQRALDAAFDVYPERFVLGRTTIRLPPNKVTIDPIDPGAPLQTAAALLAASASAPPPSSRCRQCPSCRA